jgi:hypothetical protein
MPLKKRELEIAAETRKRSKKAKHALVEDRIRRTERVLDDFEDLDPQENHAGEPC